MQGLLQPGVKLSCHFPALHLAQGMLNENSSCVSRAGTHHEVEMPPLHSLGMSGKLSSQDFAMGHVVLNLFMMMRYVHVGVLSWSIWLSYMVKSLEPHLCR